MIAKECADSTHECYVGWRAGIDYHSSRSGDHSRPFMEPCWCAATKQHCCVIVSFHVTTHFQSALLLWLLNVKQSSGYECFPIPATPNSLIGFCECSGLPERGQGLPNRPEAACGSVQTHHMRHGRREDLPAAGLQRRPCEGNNRKIKPHQVRLQLHSVLFQTTTRFVAVCCTLLCCSGHRIKHRFLFPRLAVRQGAVPCTQNKILSCTCSVLL